MKMTKKWRRRKRRKKIEETMRKRSRQEPRMKMLPTPKSRKSGRKRRLRNLRRLPNPKRRNSSIEPSSQRTVHLVESARMLHQNYLTSRDGENQVFICLWGCCIDYVIFKFSTERRRSRERESIRAGRISPSSRRRASRSPVHKRRPLISSRRRSRSRSRSPSSRRRHLGVNRNRPVLDRRRSRTPPHRRRRSRSRSPIELKRAERAPSPARSPRIDKAQLLEVARQNLKRMQVL